MYFDRFDILEAWYLFLAENHGGQFSKGYIRLSKMLSYFSPRQSLHDKHDLSDNGREIYNNLLDRAEEF